MVRRDASMETLTRDLSQKLRGIRDAKGAGPEEQLRAAYEAAVEESLGRLPEERADRVAAAVKAEFVDEARGRETRLRELEAEGERREEQVRALEAERDRLVAENKALRAKAEAAASAEAPPAPAAALSSAAPSSGAPDGDLDKIRSGMKMIAEGKEITAHSVGLSESDTRFLQLCRELLRFALDYEMGVNILKAEFAIGPAHGMDTQMIRGLKQEIRERFNACLDNKPGSLEALKKSLADNAKFVVLLNGAYSTALAEGSRRLLDEIEPGSILEKHKRMLGYDHEKSWQELERLHGDLAQLGKSELWERFYYEPFRAKLDAQKA